MKIQTVKKIVTLLEDLSESKARSVIDFIRYLRWSEDSFTENEIAIVQKSRKEASQGMGTAWRDACDTPRVVRIWPGGWE